MGLERFKFSSLGLKHGLKRNDFSFLGLGLGLERLKKSSLRPRLDNLSLGSDNFSISRSID